jgi:Ribbon-helix-helix domain
MEEGVRWNIKVSKETDLTLRTYLGARADALTEVETSRHV